MLHGAMSWFDLKTWGARDGRARALTDHGAEHDAGTRLVRS
jgi:hypothetical protein